MPPAASAAPVGAPLCCRAVHRARGGEQVHRSARLPGSIMRRLERTLLPYTVRIYRGYGADLSRIWRGSIGDMARIYREYGADLSWICGLPRRCAPQRRTRAETHTPPHPHPLIVLCERVGRARGAGAGGLWDLPGRAGPVRDRSHSTAVVASMRIKSYHIKSYRKISYPRATGRVHARAPG